MTSRGQKPLWLSTTLGYFFIYRPIGVGKTPNDVPSHKDVSQSPKSPIEVKGQCQICEKPLFFDGITNKKFIFPPIGLEKAPSDAPSHKNGSQSTKSHIEVKGQGLTCEKPLFFDGVPNSLFTARSGWGRHQTTRCHTRRCHS